MTISSVNVNSNVQRGKQIGTIVGAGIGTGYILKNCKDIFVNGIQEGIKDVNIPAKKMVPIAVAVSSAVLCLATGIGRLVGAGIGKIADKIKQHKAEKDLKNVLAETLPKNLKEVKPMTLDEIEKISNMTDEEASEYLSSRMKPTEENV